MNKLILVLAVTFVLFGVLAAGSQALAAGPTPGNGPWVIVDVDPADGQADRCTTNSGAPGHLLLNTNSGKTHCFAD